MNYFLIFIVASICLEIKCILRSNCIDHIFVILDTTDYPEITICPFPSYNQTAFKKYGYNNSFQYSIGKVEGSSKIFGWNGNDSTKIEKIISDISLIKSVKQCPHTRVIFAEENGNDFRYVKVDMHLTGFKHPIGQCCQAFVPQRYTEKNAIWINK